MIDRYGWKRRYIERWMKKYSVRNVDEKKMDENVRSIAIWMNR